MGNEHKWLKMRCWAFIPTLPKHLIGYGQVKGGGVIDPPLNKYVLYYSKLNVVVSWTLARTLLQARLKYK